MKKTTLALLILIFIPIFVINSQDLKSPTAGNKPLVEINVNGSFNYALFDLSGSGNLKEFWNFKNYGVGSGFGTNAEVKFGVMKTKMMQLKVHMMVGYSHFSNSDSKAYTVGWVDLGWPYKSNPNSNMVFGPVDTAGTSYLRLNMPNIAFGLECAVFTDRENKSSFNFGVDFTGTLITGRVYETIANTKESYNTINPSLRFGAGINIMYSYRFEDWVGFNVGTRFALPNLFGKSSEMTDQAGYISLLDDSNIALNPRLSSKRTLGYFQLFGGMAFYLGRM
jgi:hypothetical protein